MIESGQRVLLARRGAHQDQANLWEFPGGKVEAGETPVEALTRELDEELGIQIRSARPLLQFDYQYPTKHIRFDIYRVRQFDGEPTGREGQQIGWFEPAVLQSLSFPAANRYILSALVLPPYLLITPEPATDQLNAWRRQLAACLQSGISRVILRAPGLPQAEYLALAESLLAEHPDCQWLLHGRPDLVSLLPQASGIHLPSQVLMACDQRPVAAEYLLSVACHDPEQLAQAQAINADWALLSPVLPTQSHVDAVALGWAQFSAWAQAATVPVYALGGLNATHYPQAIDAGAVGIAGIRGFWPDA